MGRGNSRLEVWGGGGGGGRGSVKFKQYADIMLNSQVRLSFHDGQGMLDVDTEKHW